jgi:hypothetical protein
VREFAHSPCSLPHAVWVTACAWAHGIGMTWGGGRTLWNTALRCAEVAIHPADPCTMPVPLLVIPPHPLHIDVHTLSCYQLKTSVTPAQAVDTAARRGGGSSHHGAKTVQVKPINGPLSRSNSAVC